MTAPAAAEAAGLVAWMRSPQCGLLGDERIQQAADALERLQAELELAKYFHTNEHTDRRNAEAALLAANVARVVLQLRVAEAEGLAKKCGSALEDYVREVEGFSDYQLTKDIPAHKAEFCWESAQEEAGWAVKAYRAFQKGGT